MKYIKQKHMGEFIGIFNNETKESIPLDKGNTNYQEYLEWVAEGNKAMEADET